MSRGYRWCGKESNYRLPCPLGYLMQRIGHDRRDDKVTSLQHTSTRDAMRRVGFSRNGSGVLGQQLFHRCEPIFLQQVCNATRGCSRYIALPPQYLLQEARIDAHFPALPANQGKGFSGSHSALTNEKADGNCCASTGALNAMHEDATATLNGRN